MKDALHKGIYTADSAGKQARPSHKARVHSWLKPAQADTQGTQ